VVGGRDAVHWFNQTRLRSSVGHAAPIEYETTYHRHIDPQQQSLPGELGLHQTGGGSAVGDRLRHVGYTWTTLT
jgi:hypothetical protein